MIKAYVLPAVLLAFGSAVVMRPVVPPVRRSEAWLANISPTKVGDFAMECETAGCTQTYRMDATTYDKLKPYGIVSRIMNDGRERYDTVVIASDWQWSFHDPRDCFSGQGWAIEQDKVITIPAGSLGQVPIHLLTLNKDGHRTLAAFCFKGPKKMHASQDELFAEWFWNDVANGKRGEGAMFRFIALDSIPSQEGLTRFIGNFLETADRESQGFL